MCLIQGQHDLSATKELRMSIQGSTGKMDVTNRTVDQRPAKLTGTGQDAPS